MTVRPISQVPPPRLSLRRSGVSQDSRSCESIPGSSNHLQVRAPLMSSRALSDINTLSTKASFPITLSESENPPTQAQQAPIVPTATRSSQPSSGFPSVSSVSSFSGSLDQKGTESASFPAQAPPSVTHSCPSGPGLPLLIKMSK